MSFKKATDLFERRRNQQLLLQSVFYTRMRVLVLFTSKLGLACRPHSLREEMTPVTDNTANRRLGVEKANTNTGRLGRTYATRHTPSHFARGSLIPCQQSWLSTVVLRTCTGKRKPIHIR